MRFRTSLVVACAAVAALVAGNAKAATVQWTIVSSASSIRLNLPNSSVIPLTSSAALPVIGGTSLPVSLSILNPIPTSLSNTAGGTWSTGNTQRVGGLFSTINSNEDPLTSTSIQFLAPIISGDQISGIDSGIYRPGTNGDPALTASADLATRILARAGPGGLIGVGAANVDLAIRDLLYRIDSLPIASGGGSFDATDLNFGFDGANVNFGARNGGPTSGLGGSTLTTEIVNAVNNAVPMPRTIVLPSESTPNNSAAGSIVSLGGKLRQITIPINIPYTLEIGDDISITGSVVGTIVAVTEVVPEPGTFVMLAIGAAAMLPMARRRLLKKNS